MTRRGQKWAPPLGGPNVGSTTAPLTALWLMVVLLCGCEVGPTQLVVVVDSDWAPGSELEQVEIAVTETGLDAGSDVRTVMVAETPTGEEQTLPFSFGVTPGPAEPREVEITVRGLGPGEGLPVETAVRAAFVRHQILRLPIVLWRQCVGVFCPDGQRCDASSGRPLCVAELVEDLEPIAPGSELDGAVRFPEGGAEGSVCAESPCRLLHPQCGCPDGHGCYASATSGVRSCAAEGILAEGDLCSRSAQCAAGLHCLLTGDESPENGTCARYCETDAHCLGTGCLFLDGLGVCAPDCDPVQDVGCPAPLTCSYALRDTLHTICREPGSVAQGEVCRGVFDCQTGLACAHMLGPVGTCESPCDTTFPCPAPTICIPSTLGQGHCSVACDPVRGLGCPAGLACSVLPLTSEEVGAICHEPGLSVEGGACVYSTDCARGLGCVGEVCMHWCELDTDLGCTPGGCRGTDPELRIGDVVYGVCPP